MCFIFILCGTSQCAPRCPNLAVKEAEDDENVEEDDAPVEKTKKVSHAKRKKQTECNLTWIGEPVLVIFFCDAAICKFPVLCVQYLNDIFASTPFQTEGKRNYYKQVSINNEVLEVGDCVSVSSEDPSVPLFLAR